MLFALIWKRVKMLRENVCEKSIFHTWLSIVFVVCNKTSHKRFQVDSALNEKTEDKIRNFFVPYKSSHRSNANQNIRELWSNNCQRMTFERKQKKFNWKKKRCSAVRFITQSMSIFSWDTCVYVAWLIVWGGILHTISVSLFACDYTRFGSQLK